MRIWIAILTVIALIFAAQYIFGGSEPVPAAPEIEILDGPGSYIEVMTGTVLEVTDVDESHYSVLLRPDPEYADAGDTVRFDIYDIDDGRMLPEPGAYVMMRYPGGVSYGGDPLCIPTSFLPMPAEE